MTGNKAEMWRWSLFIRSNFSVIRTGLSAFIINAFAALCFCLGAVEKDALRFGAWLDREEKGLLINGYPRKKKFRSGAGAGAYLLYLFYKRCCPARQIY